MSKVFVKLVSHPSAQNRRAFIRDKNGKKQIEQAKSHGTNGASIFRFIISDKGRNMLNTGLDEMVQNPWFDKPEKLSGDFSDGNFHKREKISKQEYFEVKLGKSRGALSSENGSIFGNRKDRTFLQTFYRDFSETTVLDLDNPTDELTYHLLQVSHPDKCANSYEETTPFSRLYISFVNEDEKKQAAKSEQIENAIAKLVNLKEKHGEEDIRKVCIVMNLIKGDVPVVKMKNALSDHIMKPGDKQLDKIAQFNEVYDLLKNKKSRELFEAKYLLQECINNRIISDYKGKYVWNSKKGTNLELLGKSKEEAEGTLLDIDWRNYREELTEELKNKVNDDRLMAL